MGSYFIIFRVRNHLKHPHVFAALGYGGSRALSSIVMLRTCAMFFYSLTYFLSRWRHINYFNCIRNWIRSAFFKWAPTVWFWTFINTHLTPRFLYDRYRGTRRMWETSILIRKLLIICAFLFLTKYAEIQVSWCDIFLSASLCCLSLILIRWIDSLWYRSCISIWIHMILAHSATSQQSLPF